jgi:hypothetical protein
LTKLATRLELLLLVTFSVYEKMMQKHARKVMGIHGYFVKTIHQYAMPDVAY